MLCSHYHMDHAGLVQDGKDMNAVHILMESQVGAPQVLSKYVLGKGIQMTPITDSGHILLQLSESRVCLAGQGPRHQMLPYNN